MFTYKYMNAVSTNEGNDDCANNSNHPPRIGKSKRHCQKARAKRCLQEVCQRSDIAETYWKYAIYFNLFIQHKQSRILKCEGCAGWLSIMFKILSKNKFITQGNVFGDDRKLQSGNVNFECTGLFWFDLRLLILFLKLCII